jgi:hypothetical protein
LELQKLDKVPDEDLAIKVRKEIDELRSVQLYAELKALQQTVEALRESLENVNKMATNLAGVYLQKWSILRKLQRPFKLSKWAWITIIATIVIVGLIIIFR